MSCQQLIQEDPYIFTDTISNATSFISDNNSQATKYVPLNRQTIYSRQFRQHEPTLATDCSSSVGGGGGAPLLSKSTTFSDHHQRPTPQQKIVINPSSLKEIKRNGFNNGKMPTSAANSMILMSSPSSSSSCSSSASSPRTSPKFFKSHQHQPPQNGKHGSSSNNSSTLINHSIASVSKAQTQKQSQQFHQSTNKTSTATQLNHVAESLLSSSPPPAITGIKQEVSNEDDVNGKHAHNYLNANASPVKAEEEIEIKREESFESEQHARYCMSVGTKKSKRTNKRKEKLSLRKSSMTPNVIVESISFRVPRNAPQVQSESSSSLNVIDERTPLLQNYRHGDDESRNLTRDERLSMRKLQLRHVLSQYRGVNQMQHQQRSTEQSRMQFNKTRELLKMLDRTREKTYKKSIATTCNMRDCSAEAIVSSDFCSKHILLTEREQFLVRQCCFIHSDGHQCRVPISDIMATVAVCKDHSSALPHQLVISSSAGSSSVINDSTKPKKPIQRKQQRTNNSSSSASKTSPLIRPVKKCASGGGTSNGGKAGRKKKSDLMVPVHRPTMIIHPSDLQKSVAKSNSGSHHNNIQMSLSSSSTSSSPSLSSSSASSASSTRLNQPLLKQESLLQHSDHHHNQHQFIHQNSGYLLASSQSSYGSMSSGGGTDDLYLKQDLMTSGGGVCENSYESSEDTGVGGLSENELISHDVIGNFDMESCAELSKVLSSLPSNTLDDLLTEPLHTSRDDEEYLDRAIEEVSATGMDQIAITAFEHLEGLDMLEMLDDDEQRQMISAATNLISMSGYMSSHDQDNNYSAMPSPMMS